MKAFIDHLETSPGHRVELGDILPGEIAGLDNAMKERGRFWPGDDQDGLPTYDGFQIEEDIVVFYFTE